MATVLRVGNSEGWRRCDATCHRATHEKCACVCGGMFHGKKILIASPEFPKIMQEWVKKVFDLDVPTEALPVEIGNGALF